MISILMPIYNGSEFLRESLASVVAQTFPRWELLIGVNGHPPNSKTYQEAYEYNSVKIRVFDLLGVSGKSQALNTLVQRTRYDLTCLLDVDDLWDPLKLEVQLGYISDYDVVGTDAKYFGDRKGVPGVPSKELDVSAFKRQNPIVNSSAMFHKEHAHWEDIQGVEDYDMWCRLAVAGKKFYNVPHVLVHHRIHAGSAFNIESHLPEIKMIRAKHGLV